MYPKSSFQSADPPNTPGAVVLAKRAFIGSLLLYERQKKDGEERVFI